MGNTPADQGIRAARADARARLAKDAADSKKRPGFDKIVKANKTALANVLGSDDKERAFTVLVSSMQVGDVSRYTPIAEADFGMAGLAARYLMASCGIVASHQWVGFDNAAIFWGLDSSLGGLLVCAQISELIAHRQSELGL